MSEKKNTSKEDNKKKKITSSNPKNPADNKKQTGTIEKKSGLTRKKKQNLPALADEIDNEAASRGDQPMSVVGHLNEFRSRLIVILLTIVVVSIVALFFSEYVLKVITKPYKDSGMSLNVFTLVEGVMLKLKAALIVAVLIGLPVIFFELWRYISPAIEKKDRKFIGASVITSLFLMYGGISFAFFVLLPIAVKMLLKFMPKDMNPVIGASQYLNFFLLFSLAMGVMFELPIIAMILTKLGILSPQLLTSKRKYAIVLIWVFAAVITPGPDVLSQSLVAIPVMLLYEISVIISKIIMRNKLKKEKTAK